MQILISMLYLTPLPDPIDPTKRRTFSASFKRQVLRQIDYRGKASVASVLARFGVSASCVSRWRAQSHNWLLESLQPRRRGPRVGRVAELELRVAELTEQLAALEGRPDMPKPPRPQKPPRTKYACSKCGKLGHRAPRCGRGIWSTPRTVESDSTAPGSAAR